TEHTYYYYLNSVDMRKGFNGLSGIVKEHMDQNQNTNVVYAFINKKKDKLKLLHWRVGGFVLYYKRLEKGIFELPEYNIEEGLVVLTYTEMIMILDGISIVNTHKKERYQPN
ncbi:IS66 family insertion sequence element accessory protein TnpB, partial [Polaribacter sp. IC063]